MTSHRITSDSGGSADRLRSAFLRGVVLVLLLLGLRLPLLAHPTPVHLDEQNFMAALGFPAEYPVQHPGYPLWVAMGTAARASGFGPYASYQAWSVLASVAAPLLLYVGLRGLVGDATAWWLGVGLGVNPLVWFQAATALSYSAGGAVGLLVVGLCYRALATGRRGAMFWASAILAASIALRGDLLVYVGPIVAYVAWRFRRRGGVPAAMLVVAGFAGFAAVASYLYGRGDPTAVHPRLGHTVGVVLGTSVFKLGMVDGLIRNLVKIVLNLGWDYGVAAVVLPPAIWQFMRHRRAWPADVSAVLLLWTAPILVFLALMHVVQGYFMVLLPAGYCVIGLALHSRYRPAAAARVAAVIAICSAVQFLGYPWSADSTGFKRLLDAKIAFQSASGLRQIDRRLEIHAPGDFWRTGAHGG